VPQETKNSLHPTGIGYVVIPFDLDRSKYISTCYRRERISIQLDDGGSIVQNCYISKNLLSQLSFPKEADKLGSAVSFIVPKFHNIPIIVGVLSRPGETQLLDENIHKRVVKSDAGVVSISMNPKGGLFVSVDSNFENQGNVYIDLKAKNNSSKFNVSCQGDINIYSEGNTSLEVIKSLHLIKSEVNKGVKNIHSKIEFTEEGILIEDKFKNKIKFTKEGKIFFDDGSSPVVKGDELQSQLIKMKATLDAFIDMYLQTVTTIIADSGVSAKALMETAMGLTRKENFQDINSDRIFIK